MGTVLMSVMDFRYAQHEELNGMKVQELRKLATARNVKIPRNSKKDVMVGMLVKSICVFLSCSSLSCSPRPTKLLYCI